MTLPSLTYYYEHKEDLRNIHVHLEFENLLHRSGFKDLEELHEVLEDHAQNKSDNKMIISGIWTHFDMLMSSMFQSMILRDRHG